jgi:hypothetical protein
MVIALKYTTSIWRGLSWRGLRWRWWILVILDRRVGVPMVLGILARGMSIIKLLPKDQGDANHRLMMMGSWCLGRNNHAIIMGNSIKDDFLFIMKLDLPINKKDAGAPVKNMGDIRVLFFFTKWHQQELPISRKGRRVPPVTTTWGYLPIKNDERNQVTRTGSHDGLPMKDHGRDTMDGRRVPVTSSTVLDSTRGVWVPVNKGRVVEEVRFIIVRLPSRSTKNMRVPITITGRHHGLPIIKTAGRMMIIKEDDRRGGGVLPQVNRRSMDHYC